MGSLRLNIVWPSHWEGGMKTTWMLKCQTVAPKRVTHIERESREFQKHKITAESNLFCTVSNPSIQLDLAVHNSHHLCIKMVPKNSIPVSSSVFFLGPSGDFKEERVQG